MKHTITIDLPEKLYRALKTRCGTELNPAAEIQRIMIKDLMSRGILNHTVRVEVNAPEEYMFKKWKVYELAIMQVEALDEAGVYDGNYDVIRHKAKLMAKELWNEQEVSSIISSTVLEKINAKRKTA